MESLATLSLRKILRNSFELHYIFITRIFCNFYFRNLYITFEFENRKVKEFDRMRFFFFFLKFDRSLRGRKIKKIMDF